MVKFKSEEANKWKGGFIRGINKCWKLENSWNRIFPGSTKYDKRFNYLLFERYCAVSKNSIVLFFLSFLFSHRYSVRANYDVPWRYSSAPMRRALKAFSREIFAQRAFKTNDSERREKGVFFSRRQGKQGIRVHFAPSPSRNRKEHGNCSTAL